MLVVCITHCYPLTTYSPHVLCNTTCNTRLITQHLVVHLKTTPRCTPQHTIHASQLHKTCSTHLPHHNYSPHNLLTSCIHTITYILYLIRTPLPHLMHLTRTVSIVNTSHASAKNYPSNTTTFTLNNNKTGDNQQFGI